MPEESPGDRVRRRFEELQDRMDEIHDRVKDDVHELHESVHDLIDGEEDETVAPAGPEHRLAQRLRSLKDRGTVTIRRINYGHDDMGIALLATVIGRSMVPDFEFRFCDDHELVKRYGETVAVIAAHVKQHVRHAGYYSVDTGNGDITTVSRGNPDPGPGEKTASVHRQRWK